MWPTDPQEPQDPPVHRDPAPPSPATLQAWRTGCINYLKHELQAPLTCILAAAADLSTENFGGRLNHEELQLLNLIRRDSVKLSSTVSEVLAYLEAAEARDRPAEPEADPRRSGR